jgi:hypothetical protein
VPALLALLISLSFPCAGQDQRNNSHAQVKEGRQDETLGKKLGQPISFEWGEGRLEDAIDFLADRYDFQFEIKTESFQQMGSKVVGDREVLFGHAEKIPLGSVVQKLLNQVDGTYRTERGKLIIYPAAARKLRFDDRRDSAPLAHLTQGEGTLVRTRMNLTYCLRIKGYFDEDGFNVEEVDPTGPAAELTLVDGQGQTQGLRKGDIITEVDGKTVTSAEAYAKAMNGVRDHRETRLKIRVHEGCVWYANAAKR